MKGEDKDGPMLKLNELNIEENASSIKHILPSYEADERAIAKRSRRATIL